MKVRVLFEVEVEFEGKTARAIKRGALDIEHALEYAQTCAEYPSYEYSIIRAKTLSDIDTLCKVEEVAAPQARQK